MDGMLLLEGYKLKQAVYLNLQKHTILLLILIIIHR